MLRQLLDRITAVEQYALGAVDEGDPALAAGGGHEARIVGEHTAFPVQARDIDYVGAEAAFMHGQLGAAVLRARQREMLVAHVWFLALVTIVRPRERAGAGHRRRARSSLLCDPGTLRRKGNRETLPWCRTPRAAGKRPAARPESAGKREAVPQDIPYLRRKRSTRPPESMIFCLPV